MSCVFFVDFNLPLPTPSPCAKFKEVAHLLIQKSAFPKTFKKQLKMIKILLISLIDFKLFYTYASLKRHRSTYSRSFHTFVQKIKIKTKINLLLSAFH